MPKPKEKGDEVCNRKTEIILKYIEHELLNVLMPKTQLWENISPKEYLAIWERC